MSSCVVVMVVYSRRAPHARALWKLRAPVPPLQGGVCWRGRALRGLRTVCTILHKLPAKPAFNAQMPMPNLVIKG
jgi:hypothetical protein